MVIEKPLRRISTVSFLGSLIGPLVLVGLYGRALLDPQSHASFISQAGMMIFWVEFLSLHSSGMLFVKDNKMKKQKKLPRFSLFIVYCIFVFALAIGFECWFIAICFFISLGTRLLISGSTEYNIHGSQIAFGVVNLVGSAGIAAMLAPFLKNTFPMTTKITYPENVRVSGIFAEVPQTQLAWGVIYFSLIIAFNIYIFCKHSRGPDQLLNSEDKRLKRDVIFRKSKA